MKMKVALVPSRLEQMLFGTPVTYPANYIALNENNIGSFYGPLSTKYSYTPLLRKRLDELVASAKCSTNRFFVLHGDVCKAAQSTLSGALNYLGEGDVLVACEF
jgi:hypothetical protein